VRLPAVRGSAVRRTGCAGAVYKTGVCAPSCGVPEMPCAALPSARTWLSRDVRIMMDRCAILMAVGLLASCSTHTVSTDTHPVSVLTELSADFLAARAQPPGSRPTPPDVDLERLIGLKATSIRATLGAPDRPPRAWKPPCEAARCWSYTYGPGPAPVPNEVQQDGDTNYIVMSYGGPSLLILGVSGGRVVSADWLGQR
jgi:hypothetical protein